MTLATAPETEQVGFTLVWSPSHEVGLTDEPADSLTAEINEWDETDLLSDAHLNCTVYSDGYWKLTEYNRKILGIIASGRENTQTLGLKAAEDALFWEWERRGLIDSM